MCSPLCGVLAVDKGVIFLAVLVGVGQHYLYVLPLEMDDGVEGIVCHVLFQQVEKAVARYVSFSVVIYLESGVEVGIVVDHCLDKLLPEGEVAEEGVVGKEFHAGSVWLFGRLRCPLPEESSFLELYGHFLSIAHALHYAVG